MDFEGFSLFGNLWQTFSIILVSQGSEVLKSLDLVIEFNLSKKETKIELSVHF